MSYKPKHCCQCGEKIERTDWKPWTSRRFCELCATEYGIYDWIPRLSGIGLALTLLVISVYFQKTDQPVNLSPNRLLSSVPNGKIPSNQNAAPPSANIVQIGQTANGNVSAVNAPPLKTPDLKIKQTADAPVESGEKIYFCGAATKKGTPCSRRVKGGGRCWQHIGQPALLAQDKLLAVR